MPKIHKSGFSDWKETALSDLTGKHYVITGGNSGIGFEAAKILARHGAHIIMGARNPIKAEAAIKALRETGQDAELLMIDLADSKSIKRAAGQLLQSYSKIDGLINNAGIMQTPQLETRDGYEMQIGTNHLGHFLLTGLVYPLLKTAKGRVVTVSSIAHKLGKLYLDDIMLRRNYSPSRAYCQSKLANLVFALELQKRLTACQSPVSSYACHPGYADTALQSTGPISAWKRLYKLTNKLWAQPAYNGALPLVLCAAGKQARPGGYYGPTKMGDCRGAISDCDVRPQGLDESSAQKLWRISEDLTGLDWNMILRA